MTRGRGTKRSWGGRGGMSNKGGEGYQQLPNTSHANISEPSPPISQQVGSNQHIISSHESSFRQLIRTSQDVHAQQTTSASQNVGGQQATPASLNIGHQQAPRSSQDVGSQQETHSQDVSAEQTLASYGSSNPQARRDTTRGIISLKVNGDTFCPHEAVRNVTTAFKKSFSGSWHCWSKVPEHVRDRWFNDFEKKYSFPSKDKVFIRWTFEHVGSERLSDSLGKAKRQFSKTKEIPGWIAKDHWDVLMEYWNSENFTKKSEINSKNRMSSNNGEGPSLHTGGSVAFAEYRRRHKEITGKDLRNNELFLKSHRTKNEKKWICGKSERMWHTFTEIIKEKVGETSTSRDEEGFEVDDEEMERNMATNGDEEGEKTSEETVVDLLKTIPDEQLLKTWIEIVGGAKKGRIYGLGPKNYILADSLDNNCASSSAPNPPNIPTQQVFETPEFQQLLDRAMEQRMENMLARIQADIREDMQEEVKVAARAVVREMLGLTSQPPPSGSGCPPS
uniref:Uncharacterized protein LOC104248159 n=1 Tax=Nicotiana sylvestris TaxID=4096 RepID=A0A1U7YEY1_NICSY|nr:PREDICTED: uncharacterized protein LOC104248159 [Nicotiana sylvestris]